MITYDPTLNWDGRIPLAQVLEHARPAYGGNTWEEALAWLNSTPAEANVIAELAATLAAAAGHAQPFFSEPIVVHDENLDEPDEPDEDDEEEWDEEEDEESGCRVANGMHRIATAVRLGHTHILCASTYPDDPDHVDPGSRHPDNEYIEVRYDLPSWADSASEDAIDFACGWLRSFPLPDGTWVETDIIASHDGTLEGLWKCPHRLLDGLVAELKRRAPTLVVVEHRLTTGRELDAEYEALGIS